MNIPMDRQSGCFRCHKFMYHPADAFGHDWHHSSNGGKIACQQCHEAGREKSAESAKKCDQCHKDLIPAGSKIKFEQNMAPSYVDAMHLLCVNCHRQKARTIEGKENLAKCARCHESIPPEYMSPDSPVFDNRPYFNRVLMPGGEKIFEVVN
jgi:hypothetical protein